MKIRYALLTMFCLGMLAFSLYGFPEAASVITTEGGGNDISLDSGIAVSIPEVPSVAQSEPDLDLPPMPEEELPMPEEEPPMLPDMGDMPSAPPPMEEMPSAPPSMNAPSYASSSYNQAGDIQPGWRPVPDPSSFPRNPFSGVVSTETPIAFKDEFSALAKNILGVLEIGGNSVLIISNRVVRQGDEVRLEKEQSIGVATAQEAEKAEEAALMAPVAVFSGVDKKKEVAKFLLGDTEVRIPIPSTRKKIAKANGDVQKLETMATATLIGENGYFVVAADVIPEVTPGKTLVLRTQFGALAIKILRRNSEVNLALGEVAADVNFKGLYKGINWREGGVGLESGSVLAFDIAQGETLARPKLIQLSQYQANPNWLVGCPMLAGNEIAGIVVQKENRLSLMTQEDLKGVFPEAFAPKREEESEEPKQCIPMEEDGVFNPEKIVTLVYVKDIE